MRFLIFIGSLLFLIFPVPAYAATPTATSSPTVKPTSIIDSKVSELKERIATQVARLDIIKKRGVVGAVTDSSNNQLLIEDLKGSKRFVDVDELTKFQDGGLKQIGISDFKKGDQIEIIGLYNTESRRILARFIKKRTTSLVKLVGEITDIDNKNFILEVSQNGNSINIEIEAITKTQEWTKDEGFTKSGFSKIAVGEKIVAVGAMRGKDTMIASRILLLPEVSPNIKKNTPSPSPKPTVIPTRPLSSTGSGVKKP